VAGRLAPHLAPWRAVGTSPERQSQVRADYSSSLARYSFSSCFPLTFVLFSSSSHSPQFAATMEDSIRGPGPDIVHRALERFADDDVLLERERRRFASPPPRHGTPPRSITATSPTPDGRREPPILRAAAERRFQLEREHRSSKPFDQHEAQVDEYAPPFVLPLGSTEAEDHVKRDWLAQGIWRKRWNRKEPRLLDHPGGRWRHEDPAEDSDTSMSEPEPEQPYDDGDWFGKPAFPRGRVKRPKSDEERRQRERERQASRPCTSSSSSSTRSGGASSSTTTTAPATSTLGPTRPSSSGGRGGASGAPAGACCPA